MPVRRHHKSSTRAFLRVGRRSPPASRSPAVCRRTHHNAPYLRIRCPNRAAQLKETCVVTVHFSVRRYRVARAVPALEISSERACKLRTTLVAARLYSFQRAVFPLFARVCVLFMFFFFCCFAEPSVSEQRVRRCGWCRALLRDRPSVLCCCGGSCERARVCACAVFFSCVCIRRGDECKAK